MGKLKQWLGSVVAVSLLAGALPSLQVLADGPGDVDNNLSNNTTVETAETFFSDDDTGPAVGESTAEFSVAPGRLRLVAVPDMHFGQVPAQTVLNGGTQAMDASQTPSSSKPTNDGNPHNLVIVSDYRGATTNWSLKLAMTNEFSAGPDNSLRGLALTIGDVKGKNSSGDQAMTLGGTKIKDDGVELVKLADGDNWSGDTSYELAPEQVTLRFPEKTNVAFVRNAAYQGKLTWTLTTAP